MTEQELEDVKRIADDALVAAGARALKALDDGTALGRKYGRIEGFVIGVATGALVSMGAALAVAAGHAR